MALPWASRKIVAVRSLVLPNAECERNHNARGSLAARVV